MKDEILVIVDEENNIIGKKPRKEVEEKAILHRSANVIIENDKGEIFVHQRKKTKFWFPGMWDVKVGGVVAYGESYEDTAERELYEEAGVKDVKLDFLFHDEYRSDVNNTNRKVFRCKWNGPIKIQEEEIEQGSFMTIDEIKKIEDKLSPTAKQVFQKYLGLKKQKSKGEI